MDIALNTTMDMYTWSWMIFFIWLQYKKMVSDLPIRLERKSLAIMTAANDKIWWCSFPVRNSQSSCTKSQYVLVEKLLTFQMLKTWSIYII